MKNNQTDKSKPQEKKEAPDKQLARPGDHVFFQHPEKGPMSGHVVCCGKHGATVKCDTGEHHKVHWERILGHKQRGERAAKIIDQGEDGSICEDQNGERFFLRGNMPDQDGDESNDEDQSQNDDDGDDMKKSMFLFPKGKTSLSKAIANQPGLQLREVTDKMGHQTKRWMKTNPDQNQGKQPGAGKQEDADQQKQPGQDNQDPHQEARQKVVGNVVQFSAGSFQGKGEVTAAGKDGVTVKDDTGREHQVHWHELHTGDGENTGGGQDQDDGEDKPEPGSHFDAASFASERDEQNIKPEDIYSKFGDELKSKLEEVKGKLDSVEETIKMHKTADGQYTPERQKLHEKIISHFLSPEKIEAARPPEGQSPTFTILGGRGGSGKSWFKDKVYDSNKAITLDADEIKGMLPEYEGWNAHQVHEESGDIFDHITDLAKEYGLNIVHDATMKTPEKAKKLVQQFKDDGFNVEAHYMFLPRHEAATRAVGRFLGPTNRYVPVEVVLSNTKNEQAFDSIKGMVDKWSFRDNNVKKGEEPRLVAESKGSYGKKNQSDTDKMMTKSHSNAIFLLWRKTP